MAIDIDVQNDKFPYLARQIQGDIAKAIGYGVDHVYEADKEFIDFISKFSIDTMYGEWLDQLGIIVGFPRPYVLKPFETFEFDSTDFLLDGLYHGFSTTDTITIDGVEYDRNDGGILDDIYRETTETPVKDDIYKRYLYAITLLKNTHSLKNIANVLELFIDSTRYAFIYNNEPGYVNDLIIYIAATSADYKESLQIAFNNIFTTPPFVIIDISVYFDELFTVPEIKRIIKEVTGSDTGYEVAYSIENKKAVFTITLDSSLAEYETAVKDAVELHFAGANDVIIIVQVEEI
jgi:hypothetical protein